jgi:hypothetical protein
LSKDLRTSVGDIIYHLLNLEMSFFLCGPDQADNKSNGHKGREFIPKVVGTIRVNLPQDRKARFEIAIIPKSRPCLCSIEIGFRFRILKAFWWSYKREDLDSCGS